MKAPCSNEFKPLRSLRKYYCKRHKEFEDTNGVIRIRERTANTMTKRKKTNNDLQNITQETKDPTTRTDQKQGLSSVPMNYVIYRSRHTRLLLVLV